MIEMLERIARELAYAPEAFVRTNKGEPEPFEVCIDTAPGEPIGDDTIVVLARFRDADAADADMDRRQGEIYARAVLAALREPTEAMVKAGWAEGDWCRPTLATRRCYAGAQ